MDEQERDGLIARVLGLLLLLPNNEAVAAAKRLERIQHEHGGVLTPDVVAAFLKDDGAAAAK